MSLITIAGMVADVMFMPLVIFLFDVYYTEVLEFAIMTIAFNTIAKGHEVNVIYVLAKVATWLLFFMVTIVFASPLVLVVVYDVVIHLTEWMMTIYE